MLRLIIRLIAICLFLVSLTIVMANSGLSPHHCGASLEFRYIDDYRYYTGLYDFNTGISLSSNTLFNEDSDLSSDGIYRYVIPEDRTQDIIIEDTRTGERRPVYRNPHLLRVRWSADSSILLVWKFDGLSPLAVIRLNVETAEVLSSYEFPTRATGQGSSSLYSRSQQYTSDRRYLYSSFSLNLGTEARGLTFLDTVTGRLTHFRKPTSAPYLWSDDSRWVASEFEGMLSIIDPQTGSFHPEFSEAIEGEGITWHENALWFSRRDSEKNYNIWRANLSDASFEMMIENARLETISQNGEYASIIDGHSDDLVIYDFATENRHSLDISDKMETHYRIVRYSDNGRCLAMLLSNHENQDEYELRIIDMDSYRTIQERILINTFEIYEMNWIEQ